jgi:S1-C subfamily serine protease
MHIVAHGPAAKSTLQTGDRIVAVDGEAIAGESDFKRLLSQKAGGETLALDVAREDETMRVNLKASDWPQ